MYSDFFYGVLASASAGLIGRLVCHPIDTIKAKLQANYNFKGVADVVKTTYIREGARGFYQGLGTVLVGGIPGVCIYLTTYETCKMEMQKRKVFGANDFGVYFSCGMLAEAVW